MEIKRDIHLKRLVANRHNGLIKVITGIRRSGKSYLLRVLFRNFLIGEGIKENHIIEVDLEDRRNRKYRNPDALLDYIDSLIVDSDMYYILLDEIQLVSEFEDVLNSYLSVRNADIYVTGSNSRFLSKDVECICGGEKQGHKKSRSANYSRSYHRSQHLMFNPQGGKKATPYTSANSFYGFTTFLPFTM